MKWRYAVLLVVCHGVCAQITGFGAENTAQYPESNAISADVKAYCQYIKEAKHTEKILLRTPDAIARLDNGLNYNNFQKIAIAGLSKDLADFSKAHFLNALIEKECAYYNLNQQARLQIQYALARVNAEALHFKLEEVQAAKKKIHQLLQGVQQKLEKHNDTLIHYYTIDSSLLKLNDTERSIYIELASQQIPKIPSLHLKTLLHRLSNAQAERKKILDTLARQNNWSLRLEVGAQQDLSNSQNQNAQAYFALLLRYNLGALYASSKGYQSVDNYMHWQKTQVLGTQQELIQLIHSVRLLRHAYQARLTLLKESDRKTRALGQKLRAAASNQATHFKQQIEVDGIMQRIERNYLIHALRLLDTLA